MESRDWHTHYPAHVPISLKYPEMPLHELLSRTARCHPGNPALIFAGQVITYYQLEAMVKRLAAGLQRLGLRQGERVAVYMPNCPQLVIAYYATWMAGGVVVPVNPLYVAHEFERQINDAGARLAICLDQLHARLQEVEAQTSLEQVIVTGLQEFAGGPTRNEPPSVGKTTHIRWLQEVLQAAPEQPATVDVAPDHIAALLYTGGTTGVPKGAQLSHRNLVANAVQMATWLQGALVEGQEITLSALPLTHSYGLTVSLNQSIYRGFAQVLIPNARQLDDLLMAIHTHRPSLFPGVPSLYAAINHHPGVRDGQIRLTSVKVCISGAASLPPEVQNEFQRLSGGRLVEGYGLTEASPVTHCNPVLGAGQVGSIGLPLPDTDCKIVDADTESETLGPEQAGVLCVSGPQVMQGYWKMPEETAQVLRRDGTGRLWLHTGDVAVMSADGYFRIIDRKKDTILTAGGYSVYPREIEDVLYEHPKVREAAVIGVPVGGRDQRPKAFVVLRPGQTATADEIVQFCQARLAPFKVPKAVEFRSELPKSGVGKVLRRALVEAEKT